MKKSLLLLFVFKVYLSAFATNYYVNDGSLTGDIYCTAIGSAGNNGLTPATPKASLSQVLTSYATSFLAGDIIYVDAGTYSDVNLSSPLNGVTIKGAGNQLTEFVNGCADCYLMYINDNNTTLQDFTLTNYNDQTAGNGQALGVIGGTLNVSILNVIINKTSTTSTGSDFPIIVGDGASVLFQGGGSTCNDWDAGGGIHVKGTTANVTIQNYLFVGSYHLWATPSCAGLIVDGGTVNVKNSLFDNNEVNASTNSGSAIYINNGIVNISDCIISNNKTRASATLVGGAVYIGNGNVTIKRSIIKNHTRSGGTGTIQGSGIGVRGGTVLIDSCGFSGNVGHGSPVRGNDFFNRGGNVTIRYCTFGSAANQIGASTAGTTTVSNSGSPSFSTSYNFGLSFVNTTAPGYTANPTTPQYLGDCASSIVILSAELHSFSGNCQNNDIYLNWSTTSERNNDYFIVERLNNNGVLENVGYVNGSGSSQDFNEYQLIDNSPNFSDNYYYLSQVDYDGKKTLLKVIRVEQCQDQGVFSYNSNENSILLKSENLQGEYKFDLYDLNGKLLDSQSGENKQNDNAQFILNKTTLNGMYFIVYQSNKQILNGQVLILNH